VRDYKRISERCLPRSSVAGLAAVVGRGRDLVDVPPNRIPSQCERITPEMLPLVSLSQEEIDRIAEPYRKVRAIFRIFILWVRCKKDFVHHLLERQGDAYLLRSVLAFDSRVRLDSFLSALQAVIDRHDILRTSFAWEGLSEPVAGVWRQRRCRWKW